MSDHIPGDYMDEHAQLMFDFAKEERALVEEEQAAQLQTQITTADPRDIITRRSIADLSCDELEEQVEAIRVRRMTYVEKLRKKTATRGTATEMAYSIKREGEVGKILKRLSKLSKDSEAIIASIQAIRAMDMQNGDDE